VPAAIVIIFASLVFVAWVLGARLCLAIDENYPAISKELGPWNETMMQISGSARLTAFVWSSRALQLAALRHLVIAIRLVSVIYGVLFLALFSGILVTAVSSG
jgi:hypothetical protein